MPIRGKLQKVIGQKKPRRIARGPIGKKKGQPGRRRKFGPNGLMGPGFLRGPKF